MVTPDFDAMVIWSIGLTEAETFSRSPAIEILRKLHWLRWRFGGT
jgi:hypothetical protein